MLSSIMSLSSNHLISISVKFLSSLEYLIEGIIIDVVFWLIPGNSAENFTLLHTRGRWLFLVSLKFKGLCFLSNFNLAD